MKRIGILLVCLLVVPVLVSADLTIKEKTYIRAFMGVWASEGSEVTYIKDGKMRSESETERSGIAGHSAIKDPPPAVTIVRLDKGVVWHVNLKDRTYMESVLDPVPEAEGGVAGMFDLKELTVEKMGETREVMGKKCDGVKAVVVFKTERDDGPMLQTVDLVFWMTSEVEALEEMRSFWENMIEMTQGRRDVIPLGDAMTQLWEKIGDDGQVPLAMEMSMSGAMDPEEEARMMESIEATRKRMEERSGEKQEIIAEPGDTDMKMTREIISISEGKLDDSLFEIPDDFRKAKAIRIW